MRQLSGMDASYIYMETPRTPLHITSLGIYDQSTVPGGMVRFKRLLEYIGSKYSMVPQMRDRMVRVPFDLGHPWWVPDPDFDIEFHVRHIALPKPGDWRQLCIEAARLHALPLDHDRPLWETYIIEGLDNVEGLPPGCFAILGKTHHAAIDGASGTHLGTTLHDLTPDAEDPVMPPVPPAAPLPSPYELLVRAQMNNLTQPLRINEVLQRALPELQRLSLTSQPVQAEPPTVGLAPRTRFSGSVSAHRIFEGRGFPLEKMRAIKSAVPGSTINDVVLAVVAGALRRYLDSKSELPTEPLITLAPMSIRSDKDSPALGNQVTGIALPIPTDIADPLERLRVVHATTTRSKEAAAAVPAATLMDLQEAFPFALAGVASRLATSFRLSDGTTPVVNTVITNVPGPQFPLYHSGAKMLRQFGLGPVTDGMGLMHPVFSYNGEITISVSACRNMMPDPAFYAECLQTSFDELAAATAPPKSSAPSRKKRASAAS